MATISLENVTRTYVASGWRDPVAQAKGEPTINESSHNERSQPVVVPALDGLTLTIPNGRTVAVVGPSGCGKSTLLRVIAGLDREYEGVIYYNSRDMRDVPPRERYMGMVFQGYALYPHFHGYNNMRFQFMVRKAPDEEADERIRITADMMGYGFRQLLGRKPGTLSGGEQQRLALARALVRKPDILLLDEPLSNLDAKLRTQTRIEIKKLLDQFEITAVYVTHDQMEAISLADLIAVMRAGRIEQVGTYQQIRSRPANTFVAGFLGIHPLNLLPAFITEQGAVRIGELELNAPQGIVVERHAGEHLTAGIQPEDLAVVLRSHVGQGVGMILGDVDVVEPDFAQKVQYVRLHTAYGTITATADATLPLAYGQTVSVVSREGSAQLFDSVDGRNLLNAV